MTRHLVLSTFSFALCFAMWGLIGAFGPIFTQTFGLSSTQAALLVVVPVLLGSLARIPTGILADRFGGRAVFTSLTLLVAVAAAIVPLATSYEALLAGAFFLGLAGSSFAVGVGYVSGWAPPDDQGSALGIYGLGTMGQSAAGPPRPAGCTACRLANRLLYRRRFDSPVWVPCLRFLREMRPSENHRQVWASSLDLLRSERLALGTRRFLFPDVRRVTVAFSVHLLFCCAISSV